MAMLAELNHRTFQELLELASDPTVTQLEEIRDAVRANAEAARFAGICALIAARYAGDMMPVRDAIDLAHKLVEETRP